MANKLPPNRRQVPPIRVYPDAKDQLTALAEEAGESLSWVCTLFLAEGLERYPTGQLPFDRASRQHRTELVKRLRRGASSA